MYEPTMLKPIRLKFQEKSAIKHFSEQYRCIDCEYSFSVAIPDDSFFERNPGCPNCGVALDHLKKI